MIPRLETLRLQTILPRMDHFVPLSTFRNDFKGKRFVGGVSNETATRRSIATETRPGGQRDESLSDDTLVYRYLKEPKQ